MADLPLTSGELVQMRATLETALAGTAVIHTATATADGQGGYTHTYSAASTVSARLAPAGGGAGRPGGVEEEMAGRLVERQTYVLTLPSTATVDEDDRVVFNSVTYEVVQVESRVPWHLDVRTSVVRLD